MAQTSVRSLVRVWNGTGEETWSLGLVDQEGSGEEEAAVIPGSQWVVQRLAPLRVGKERSGLQTGSCWLLCERSREQGRGQETGLPMSLCFWFAGGKAETNV